MRGTILNYEVKHVLGKVTGHEHSGGPDVLLDVVVPCDWLRDARTIEVDLPRHLSCAACSGAGCDTCDQSGAITVRGKSELAEVLRVTLPKQDLGTDDVPVSPRSLILKVPGYGGLPNGSADALARGRLLLRISTSGNVSSCVREVSDRTMDDTLHARVADSIPAEPISSLRGLGEQAVHTSSRLCDVPRTLTRLRDASPTFADNTEDRSEPAPTRRSFAPPPITVPRVNAAAVAGARPRQRSAAVEPSIGWTWRDTFIGLVLLVLGAVVARFFF